MANHKSALKRARQSQVKRLRNMAYKTKVKKAVKDVRTALSENSADKAGESLKSAVSIIQKTVSKGVIPKKRASRKISRLTRQVSRLASS